MIILGILIFVTEIKGMTKGAYFFQVFGKNPLFIYLLSEILATVLFTIKTGPKTSLFNSISNTVFQKILPGPWGSLLFALCYMMLCWLVGYWMDKRKIYVRV